MEVLSSRVLVRPTDFERSFRFYAENLGLHVYRQWGSGSTRGVVFFLGGGFLELSGSLCTRASESVGLWLQVRDVDGVGHELEGAGVDIIELPTDKPWGLREMQVQDPDGLKIVSCASAPRFRSEGMSSQTWIPDRSQPWLRATLLISRRDSERVTYRQRSPARTPSRWSARSCAPPACPVRSPADHRG